MHGNNARKACRQIIGKLFFFVEKCMHIVALPLVFVLSEKASSPPSFLSGCPLKILCAIKANNATRLIL